MKILLAPFGSRGDVHPMIALAERLDHAGHEVLIAGPPDFVTAAERRQLHFNEQFAELPALARGFDLIVGAGVQIGAPSVAELLGIPYRYKLARSSSAPLAGFYCGVDTRACLQSERGYEDVDGVYHRGEAGCRFCRSGWRCGETPLFCKRNSRSNGAIYISLGRSCRRL